MQPEAVDEIRSWFAPSFGRLVVELDEVVVGRGIYHSASTALGPRVSKPTWPRSFNREFPVHDDPHTISDADLTCNIGSFLLSDAACEPDAIDEHEGPYPLWSAHGSASNPLTDGSLAS